MCRPDTDTAAAGLGRINPVDTVVYLNRELRAAGLVQIRTECSGETLDCGECKAFALCDHEVAHIYVRDMVADGNEVRRVLEAVPGVESVLAQEDVDALYLARGHGSQKKRSAHHPGRSGDFVCIADRRSWFAYYYWIDDSMAPDFAHCINIHRKPG